MIAWGLAGATIMSMGLDLIFAAFIFPVGFLALFRTSKNALYETPHIWMYAALLIGWIVYGVLTLVIMRSKSRKTFWIYYIIFCVLLTLNTAGCHHIIRALNSETGIH